MTGTGGSSGPNLAHLGPSWARFRSILGHPGGPVPFKNGDFPKVFERFSNWRSWSQPPRPYPIQGHPGLILGPLATIWGHLVTILGRSWGHLGPPWAPLGPSLGLLGGILADLGAILSHPRPLGGGRWGDLGPTWALWGPPGASLALPWVPWGALALILGL